MKVLCLVKSFGGEGNTNTLIGWPIIWRHMKVDRKEKQGGKLFQFLTAFYLTLTSSLVTN